ncbi:MAG: hypothetical protein HUJ69_06895 [Lachnospiraceae bacterium]|nr:hypothetical protein [Lachnospiraceae bacterium]
MKKIDRKMLPLMILSLLGAGIIVALIIIIISIVRSDSYTGTSSGKSGTAASETAEPGNSGTAPGSAETDSGANPGSTSPGGNGYTGTEVAEIQGDKSFSGGSGHGSDSGDDSEDDEYINNDSKLVYLKENVRGYKYAWFEESPNDLTRTTYFSSEIYWDWYYMMDADYQTYADFDEGIHIHLANEKTIQGIWIIFNYGPGEWNLTAGGSTQTCGQRGIIHEYVPLDSPSRTADLYFYDYVSICDIFVIGEGELPRWVQNWQMLDGQADMMVFPTHSDDEEIFFGGVLPTYAGQQDLKVQVAYMVYHDQPRPHELLNGLWTCGVKYYPYIGPCYDVYADDLEDALSIYDYDELLFREVWLLRQYKPSVIVCHDEAGEYGHGAHILYTYSMEEAVYLANDDTYGDESLELYGTWDVPKMYIHLYSENQLVMDWHQPLSAFDGMTALEVATRGYDYHFSQHEWNFRVLEEGYGDCRLFGLYRSTVGPDVQGNDMMENIEVRR